MLTVKINPKQYNYLLKRFESIKRQEKQPVTETILFIFRLYARKTLKFLYLVDLQPLFIFQMHIKNLY